MFTVGMKFYLSNFVGSRLSGDNYCHPAFPSWFPLLSRRKAVAICGHMWHYVTNIVGNGNCLSGMARSLPLATNLRIPLSTRAPKPQPGSATRAPAPGKPGKIGGGTAPDLRPALCIVHYGVVWCRGNPGIDAHLSRSRCEGPCGEGRCSSVVGTLGRGCGRSRPPRSAAIAMSRSAFRSIRATSSLSPQRSTAP